MKIPHDYAPDWQIVKDLRAENERLRETLKECASEGGNNVIATARRSRSRKQGARECLIDNLGWEADQVDLFLARLWTWGFMVVPIEDEPITSLRAERSKGERDGKTDDQSEESATLE